MIMHAGFCHWAEAVCRLSIEKLSVRGKLVGETGTRWQNSQGKHIKLLNAEKWQACDATQKRVACN